jgi:hypothetical protein
MMLAHFSYFYTLLIQRYIFYFLEIGPACSAFIGRHYTGACETRGSNPRRLATSLGGFAIGPLPSSHIYRSGNEIITIYLEISLVNSKVNYEPT